MNLVVAMSISQNILYLDAHHARLYIPLSRHVVCEAEGLLTTNPYPPRTSYFLTAGLWLRMILKVNRRDMIPSIALLLGRK